MISVTDHGAVADGSEPTTRAIQETIDAVAAAGGGVAHVPPGTYVTGTIELKDGVTLHVESGATILGATDRSEYDPVETSLGIYPPSLSEEDQTPLSPLIVADGATEIALTGGGRIDARGEEFWTVPESEIEGRDYIVDNRPEYMIQLTDCTGVRVRDVHIENSPGWTLHLRGCRDVSVHNVRIHNSVYGPNTDGIGIDGCCNVRVSDSDVMAGGDDAIVLKDVLKGLSEDPTEPSRDITVTNCQMVSVTKGFKIGSEVKEGFDRVVLSDSIVRAPIADVDYEVDERFGEKTGPNAGISLESPDGGILENILISNIAMWGAESPLHVNANDRGSFAPSGADTTPGRIQNVSISDIVALDAVRASPIAGLPDAPIEDLSIANVHVETTGDVTDPAVLDREVPENRTGTPAPHRFGTLPTTGFYCRHADGLTLQNVSVDVTTEDVRPAFHFEDVDTLQVDGVTGDAPADDQPRFHLTDVRRALLRGIIGPEDAESVFDIAGTETASIAITGNLISDGDPLDIDDSTDSIEINHYN